LRKKQKAGHPSYRPVFRPGIHRVSFTTPLEGHRLRRVSLKTPSSPFPRGFGGVATGKSTGKGGPRRFLGQSKGGSGRENIGLGQWPLVPDLPPDIFFLAPWGGQISPRAICHWIRGTLPNQHFEGEGLSAASTAGLFFSRAFHVFPPEFLRAGTRLARPATGPKGRGRKNKPAYYSGGHRPQGRGRDGPGAFPRGMQSAAAP